MRIESDETAPPPAAAATKSPAQWADVVFPKSASGSRPFDHWKHAAADALHGWQEHEYHAGAPLQLTEADYRAALEAIDPPRPERKEGDKEDPPVPLQAPHEPALGHQHPLFKKTEAR